MLENWYNADGRRIAKKEVVAGQTKYTFYISDGWDIVGAGNQNAQVLETFTRGVGQVGGIGTLTAVTHHAGSMANGTFYTHHNHRGDITHARGSTVTVSQWEYTAFGSLKSQTGSDVCRFKFSSKERDAATGFSYYGYRFYAPQWQRWVSRDPLGEGGGENLYAFIYNTPVWRIDPFGLDSPGCDGVPNKGETPCFLECCALHDKCFKDNSCSSSSWVNPFCSKACKKCNKDVVTCFAKCGTSKKDDPKRPNYYCGKCGVFFDDPKSVHMGHST